MSGLDPAVVAGCRQPDQRTCGPSCLVAARMLTDPAFATSVRQLGWVAEVQATFRRVTGVVAADGRMQLPWPAALGTPPWALARELSSYGVPYDVKLVRVRAGDALPAVHAAVAADHPVPIYVGDRWLPRHVVLAMAAQGSDLSVYDPAQGRVVTVTDAQVTGAHLSLSGWSVPWFVVLP